MIAAMRFPFSLALALAVFLPLSTVHANDSAEANGLMVEAIRLVDAVKREPSAEAKIGLLRKAYDNLTAIVERYPSTDLAVTLASGQRVGTISLAGVRGALDRMLLARPGRPGASVHAWRHAEGLAAATFFGDGRRALTAGLGGVVAVRDIDTGEVLHTWQHGSRITAAAVSHDRRRMLTAGADRITALRDTRTGRLLERWSTNDALSAVALSPDGRRALSGLWSAVYLFRVKERKVLRQWRYRAPVTSLAWSPDGSRAFMGFADGRARMADVRTGAKLQDWKHPGSAGGGVTAAAFSADGQRIVTGSASGMAALRNVRTGETLQQWDLGYSVPVRSVAHSPTEPWVLTGLESGKVELHDSRIGKTLREWRYDGAPVALVFSPDSRRVLMGFSDGVAIVCDLVLPGKGELGQTALKPNGGCW